MQIPPLPGQNEFANDAGASLVEVLVSVAILAIVVSTAAYQLLASEQLRKTRYERAAVVGVADSSMMQTLLAFRDETRLAAERNPLAVRTELLKSMLELVKNPPTSETGGKILTATTSVPTPSGEVRDAYEYAETLKRCKGRKAGRRASPYFSDSGLYFCMTLVEVDATKSKIWQGGDPRFPVLIEAQIQPIEAASGKTQRFDDIALERPATLLRILYSVVWVSEKLPAKNSQAVRWLAKEHHAPVF